MRFESYVILLFCISIVFQFLGIGAPLAHLYNVQTGQFASLNEIVPNALSKISSSAGILDLLSQIGIIGVAVGASVLLGGFAAVYIIPIIIFSIFIHYFIFPMDFIFSQTIGTEAKMILVVFFNILELMAFIQFSRGGN
jgi:hypothetical protein